MTTAGPQRGQVPCISVVVPCLDEQDVLPVFYARCRAALAGAFGDSYEILFVNDGSRDATWAVIQSLIAGDARVVGIDLSRNFGHQFALSAGLSVCRGELVLTIDADLQDAPELLPDMITELEKGADVVYGKRIAHSGESPFKRGTARLFYALINRLSDVPIPEDVGDFRLMRRPVVNAMLSMPEHNRFIRGMVAWLGFRQVAFSYRRDPRFAGRSKYPFGKMMRLAVDGITSFSTMPLRLTSLFGLFFCGVAALVVMYGIVSWLHSSTVPGWTSTITVVALVGGVQMLCFGIVGEYLGRIYIEVKRRPMFVVREISTQATLAEGLSASRVPVRHPEMQP